MCNCKNIDESYPQSLYSGGYSVERHNPGHL